MGRDAAGNVGLDAAPQRGRFVVCVVRKGLIWNQPYLDRCGAKDGEPQIAPW